MSKPPILPGCDVLPPMHAPSLPNEERQSKTKEKTDQRKTADRFAVLNNFVDITLARLAPSESIVWLVLYRDTKPDGTAQTGQADIARRTGLSVRTVGRAITQLVAKGLLQVTYRGRTGRGASKYIIHPIPQE